jgi:hypothetical protein
MKAQCKAAVEGAIGRKITNAESRNMEQRVRDGMMQVARKEPQRWATLSKDERLFEGAKVAAEDLLAEAAKRKQRAAQMIVAHDRIQNYIAAQVAAGHDKTPLDALGRLIAGKYDGKNNSTSAESASKGIMAQSMGRLAGAFESIKPGLLGFLANKEAESQFIRALHGVTQGIRPELVKAAKEWALLTEALRQRFNAAGGMVGKLDNWGMPHSWSQDLAVKMGKQKFVDDFMQWIDRRKYVHEDGSQFTDAEMREFLGQAWITIVSEGANKRIDTANMPPGGRGVKANRNAESRQIHLIDGDATLAALQAYSGRNVIDAMVGHVQRMSRDIALVETFGPNADYTVQHFLDRLRSEMATATPDQVAKINEKIERTVGLYDFVAGNTPPPPNRRMANAFAALRAWLTASKLGSAAITSISDEGTLYLTARVNNLPMLQLFLNEMRALNPADQMEKRLAQRAGLMVHSMADQMDRWGSETMGSHIPEKIASAVLRASGLSAITEARRRAFSITMMDAIGALTRQFSKVDDLDADDYALLRGKGITDEEWAIWRAAQPDSWRGNDTVLTPDAIYAIPDEVLARVAPDVSPAVARERAASKLLAVVLEEQDVAIIEPGARERSLIQGGTARGTLGGELRRSFFQFKTFPIAMMMRHWQRAMGMYSTTRGKAGYMAALIAAQTLLGAVAMELGDIVSGKDPRNLDPRDEFGTRNWVAAVLKGGSLGIYGDFLFAETSGYGQSLLGTLGGPMAGFIEDVDDLVRGNIMQAMRDEDTDLGAEITKFVKAYTPGSSLWYTKAALDRNVFFQMQEYFSPGYVDRMKDRARERNGTTYWWEPGDRAPERAPDLEAAAGE